jgi:methionyl aminopeptidase
MIIIKTNKEINKIRESCSIVSIILKELVSEVRPGITTNYLNNLAEKLIIESGGIPAFKGYKGFPYTICTSIDNELLHGFPNHKPLLEGSILSIDLGVNKDGFYGDSSITIPVGKTNKEKIIKVCKECLYEGIKQAKLGNRLEDISGAIQKHSLANGFDVIRDFSGHGIGMYLHEEPSVLNYISGLNNVFLKSGMVIAIEPIIVEGNYKTKRLDNGWTIVTMDNKLGAHFEHTVLITRNEPEVLT